jgi:hypothetical protein
MCKIVDWAFVSAMVVAFLVPVLQAQVTCTYCRQMISAHQVCYLHTTFLLLKSLLRTLQLTYIRFFIYLVGGRLGGLEKGEGDVQIAYLVYVYHSSSFTIGYAPNYTPTQLSKCVGVAYLLNS